MNLYGASDEATVHVTFKNGQYPTVSARSPTSKFNSNKQVLLEGTITVPVGQTAIATWTSEDLTVSELGRLVFPFLLTLSLLFVHLHALSIYTHIS